MHLRAGQLRHAEGPAKKLYCRHVVDSMRKVLGQGRQVSPDESQIEVNTGPGQRRFVVAIEIQAQPRQKAEKGTLDLGNVNRARSALV